ncbi:hypothetical protein V2A60_002032 [Cordyceps javanica]|uniref:Small secreted protein n=1 Tax=Cordyceps javanica TaxID=43265 RepID=A0A545WDW3_9HYPO|nr:hypothetical protein IF1G_00945 [Cordyceps javanica]TQW12173.1 hypothetical protein IF2G_00904 [Cordyceps javanica]
MRFISAVVLCAAAPLALVSAAAVPISSNADTLSSFTVFADDAVQQVQARAGGGIGDILKDHVKYVANPPSAAEPIPESENSALRETHRQAHKTIFEVMSGAGGAGKKGDGKKADGKKADDNKAGDKTAGDKTAGGKKAGPDAAEPADEADKAAA